MYFVAELISLFNNVILKLLVVSLKCYASWEDPDKGEKGQDLIDCPTYDNPEGKTEQPIACGSMKEPDGTNVYCAYESLMKQHGISGVNHGCVKDLVGEDNKPLNMEICYCNTDECNKNCTCGMKKSESEPEPMKDDKNMQQQVVTESNTITKKSEPLVKRNSSPPRSNLSLLLFILISLCSFIVINYIAS